MNCWSVESDFIQPTHAYADWKILRVFSMMLCDWSTIPQIALRGEAAPEHSARSCDSAGKLKISFAPGDVASLLSAKLL
jgi:hypothetical protein